jgi:hypothetical protein
MEKDGGATGVRRSGLLWRGGRLWFTGAAERRFYFFLTIIMLVFGLLYKWGIL